MPRPRKFDEAKVVDAARAQFWRDGYEGTSMSDLCRATGLRSQSLYGAFGDKHALFLRTLDDYCAAQMSGLADSRGAGPSAWEWVLSAVAFEDGGRSELGPIGCFLSSSAAALSRRDDDVRQAARETFDFILGQFAGALAEAREAGDVRADVDVDGAAHACLAAMQGIEFLRKSGVDEADFDRARQATREMLTAAYAASPR